MASDRARPTGMLAIIAGRDALPRLIAEQRQAAGLPYLVISIAGMTEPWMDQHPHQTHQFEKAGRLFAALHQAECGHVVFAGAMNRPHLKPWRADGKTVALMGKVMALLARGDDGLLSGLARIFEDKGFSVVGSQDCLEGLVSGPGMLGQHRPSDEDRADAAHGAAILAALGLLDVGQAVVVARGICLGIEAIEGTDALLARVAALPDERRGGELPSGVLVKLAKPGQDRRFDLPSIGPRTVEGGARARLRGIVVEAGGANILDSVETVRAADQAGLFLWSAAAGELAR
ncbi:MAG TPA: UDP-2,3-diacylglucosamine diphosphatase LpxI [Thermohalobaculum sp.]|nr:UDP-2,3-diacylglucosamine diphosphatase LpxI [Thermohalobaculum sp.]